MISKERFYNRIGYINQKNSFGFYINSTNEYKYILGVIEILKEDMDIVIISNTVQQFEFYANLLKDKSKYLLINNLEESLYIWNEKKIIKDTKDIKKIDILNFEEGIKLEQLIKLKKYKPDMLTSEFDGAVYDYYEIWGQFKTKCEYILFSVWTKGKNEFVEWEKDIEQPIELSIILPIYNVSKYLKECIQRLTQWDVDYIEIVAVNDESPDNSLEILKELQQQDKRITIVNKTNGGCASARQKGLEVAKGKYIGFVDPDDYTTDDMFYSLHRRIILGNYDVVYTGYKELYETTGEYKNITNDVIYQPYLGGTTNRDEIQKLIIDMKSTIWRCIYNKKFLNNNNIEFNTTLRRFDDLPFKIEVFANARSVACIEGFKYFYRQERPGQDIMANDEKLYVHFDIYEYLDKHLLKVKNDMKLYDLVQIAKIDTHYYAIRKIKKKLRKKYVRKARKDLLRNMSLFRTLLAAYNYRGKSYVNRALAIYFGVAK